MIKIDEPVNVLGEPLEKCSAKPVTGFLRDGFCNTCEEDKGSHTICVELTSAFLAFSKQAGNDLSTPRPEYNFPGLKAGLNWCLCASRWEDALLAGCAPKVLLKKTHQRALEIVSLSDLIQHAVDLN